MRQKSSKWLRLVSECLVDLSKNNVKVIFTNKFLELEDKTHSQGYWDDTDSNNLVLACMINENESDWASVFAHEYCHFLQWKEKSPIWRAANKVNSDDLYKIFNNKNIKEEKLNYCLDATRELELDCEKRTVQLMRKYKVPINMKQYIKSANAYVFFHTHAKNSRSWYPKNNSPYKNKQLVDACSSRFYKDYSVIPKNVEILFEQLYPTAKQNNVN